MNYDFSSRRALVTGASQGIGHAVAIRLAECGCAVAATGRDEQALQSLQGKIEERGGSCAIHAADLGSSEATIGMAQGLVDRFGYFDFLVNNAGTTFPEDLVDLTSEHWDRTLNVNLRAPALISRVVAPGMIERRQGSIVNISSLAGVVALREHAAYCASKFGLNGLTKVMALELGGYAIRANAIAPTVVMTPMGKKIWSEESKSAGMKAKIPANRFVEIDEVVSLVLYLLSDESAMINGEVITIDGGYSAQ